MFSNQTRLLEEAEISVLRLVSEVCHRYRLIADYFQMLCKNTGMVLVLVVMEKWGLSKKQDVMKVILYTHHCLGTIVL